MSRNQFTESEAALKYLLAGQATVTVVSKRTDTRYTYQVVIAKKDVGMSGDSSRRFVSVLTGPDNRNSYAYIGAIYDKNQLRTTPRSTVGLGAPSFRALDWVLKKLLAGELPEDLEIWHEGVCGRCGRALTVPSSIEAGLGPVCATKQFAPDEVEARC